MNLTDLITTTRRILDEASAKVWSDLDILTYLNRAGERLHLNIIEADQSAGLQHATLSTLGVTFTQVGSTKRWESSFLPDYIKTIKKLEWMESGDDDPYAVPVRDLTHDTHFEGQPEWAFLGQRKIVLWKEEAPTPADFRIFYYQRFAPLLRFRVQNAKISSTTVDVQLGLDDSTTNGLGSFSKVGDIYRGARLHVHAPLSTNSYENPAGSVRNVTAWAAVTEAVANPTYRLTVDEALVALPGASTATASLTPGFDDQFDELLCYEAATRAIDKESNERAKASFAATARDLWMAFVNAQAMRQTQQTRSVHYIPREYT